jgi:hypothetical protein
MDRKECMKSGKHNGNGGKEIDIVQIGNELVTYEDTLCSNCGTPYDRVIKNRSAL